MKKIIVAFGTRPEIIKLAPVIKELERSKIFNIIKVHTGQHDELAESMLDIFGIAIDHDLKSMTSASDLFELTEFLLPKLRDLYLTETPDAVIVQGDTTSAYLSALAAFYLKIPVYHVEAGLRSFDNYNPFPEELNRKQISTIASLHFAPTHFAVKNLLNEGIERSKIFLSGNTVIDALFELKGSEKFKSSKPRLLDSIKQDQELILVTAHRRENHGKPLSNIMDALIQLLEANESRIIVFPVHPNPEVKIVINDKSYRNDRLMIIEPLDYYSFHHILERADLVLTDSGGIQEEAAALGKNLLVLRKTTERQELLDSGFTKLVGSDTSSIRNESNYLLENKKIKDSFNPYGEGDAAAKIVEYISQL